MDEEIREEQLDGDDEEQDVDAHVFTKVGRTDDDDEQEREYLKK